MVMSAPSLASIPVLWSDPHSERLDSSAGLSWAGPRWWWSGPLDVEGVALGSVLAIARALHSYCASEGSPVAVGFTSAGVSASFSSWTHLRVGGRPIQGFAPLSGFRRAADGWVRLHANYPHHAQALFASLGASTPNGVDAAIRERSAKDVEDLVTDAGGVAARVRTPTEWASSAQARSLLAEPWIRLELRDAPREDPRADVKIPRETSPLAGV